MADRSKRTLVPRPAWLAHLERTIGGNIPLHPNWISTIKLFLVAPALLLSLQQVDVIPGGPLLVGVLFVLFGLLDYLDGVVARERDLETGFGRVFDRVTDYPLLIALSYFCVDVVPLMLLVLKATLDIGLLVLFLLGRGSTQNRLRTAMSYSTLFSLLALSQGWLPQVLSEHTVTYLLITNIAFSAIVALYNLDVLQKRFIADALSAGNLLCGVMSIGASARGHYEAALVLLMLGATFDGFDGAAARRWGSTRWGVLSDDIADGVNFGLAPAAAVFFAIGGVAGAVVGGFYALFTISRLVFFTLNKDASDPNYFDGVPSTIGGLVTLCAVILFRHEPVLVGLLVGVACAQMVSFSTHYKHLGRWVARHKELLVATPLLVLALVAIGALFGAKLVVGLLLTASLGYGMVPVAKSFAAIAKRSQRATS